MNPLSQFNRSTILIGLLLFGLLLSGCGQPKVVIVPVTTPRQLAEDLEGYVYAPDEKGQLVRSSSRVKLYHGEWILTMPEKAK